MTSKLTRNFATQDQLSEIGVLDATLLDSISATLPLVMPVTIDGTLLADGDKVLFTNLAIDNQRIYQAAIVGLNITWTDLIGETLPENQKVLIQKGTVNQKNIVEMKSGVIITANEGLNPPGGGEANTNSNAGAGGAGIVDLVKAKVGVDTPIRRIQQGANVTLTQNVDTITVAVPTIGEANTNSNSGAGGAGLVDLVKTKVGVDTPVRRLKQGSNVTLTQNADDIQIDASGEANTNSNSGAGGAGIVDLVKAKVGVDTPIRRLKQGANITLTQNADDILISATGGAVNEIELVMTNQKDFANKGRVQGFLQFPWDITAAPVSGFVSGLPIGACNAVAHSPNGEYVALAQSTAPYLTIRVATELGLENLPISLSVAIPGVVYGLAWSPDGEYLAVAHDVSPFVTVYQRSGLTFTKLANPATLPTGIGSGVAWSPNGELLAVSHAVSPFVSIYQRNGAVLTKLPNPATLPTGTGQSVSWSSDSRVLAVAHAVSPFVSLYLTSFTSGAYSISKLGNPATLPPSAGTDVAFSPDGRFLAVTSLLTPFVTIYQRTGAIGLTFTKLANPAVLPPSGCSGVAWSPNSKYLALASSLTPFVNVYTRSGTVFTKNANPTLGTVQGLCLSFSPDNQFLVMGNIGDAFNVNADQWQTNSDMPDSFNIVGKRIYRSST